MIITAILPKVEYSILPIIECTQAQIEDNLLPKVECMVNVMFEDLADKESPKHFEFAERLNRAMDRSENYSTITAIAKALNITFEAVRRYTLGTAMPRDKNLVAMASLLGVSAWYLRFGEDDGREQYKDNYLIEEQKETSKSDAMDQYIIVGGENAGESPSKDEFVMVKQYEAHGSCGHGALNDEVKVKGGLVFRRDWLSAEALPNAPDLSVIYAAGDSMYPTIESGQVLLVNEVDTKIRHGKIYLLCIDEMLYVKRLIKQEDSWIIRSDNSDKLSFPDIQISLDRVKQLEVHGRVVWRGGGL